MDTRGLARRLLAPVLDRIDRRAESKLREAEDRLRGELRAIDERVDRLERADPPKPGYGVWIPPADELVSSADEPFMVHSTCSTADFRHPRFHALCASIGHSPHLHRKLWEFVFILHHLERRELLRPGSQGLAFGVGSEPLPAAFAARGVRVVATDAPVEIGQAAGWVDSGQHTTALADLARPHLCDPERFRELVTFRTVDMNAIGADLDGFDFCWSSCCFEHLGSIRHGLDFVIESVERCLRPGGVAVHTTEFNLSSNYHTVETPILSIYRRRDIEQLVDELTGRGHQVEPFTIAPDTHYLDQFVDLPPYRERPHLKIELSGYVTTSAGLVVTRGG